MSPAVGPPRHDWAPTNPDNPVGSSSQDPLPLRSFELLSTRSRISETLWPLLQHTWWALVVSGGMMAFHELGHFRAARWVRVQVFTFSLGCGPTGGRARAVTPPP